MTVFIAMDLLQHLGMILLVFSPLVQLKDVPVFAWSHKLSGSGRGGV